MADDNKDKMPVTKFEFTGINGVTMQKAEMYDFWDELVRLELLDKDFSTDEWMNLEVEGLTNAARIWETYTPEEKKKTDQTEGSAQNPPWIKHGTIVYLWNKDIVAEVQKVIGADIFVKQSDFNAFYTAEMDRIMSDKDYVPFIDLTDNNGARAQNKRERNNQGRLFKFKALEIKVWIYVRALNQIMDISAWVQLCSTNKDKGAGTFTLQLTPTEELTPLSYANEFVEQFNIINNEQELTKDWFTKFVQNNDLVFIRFERLKMEEDIGKSLDGIRNPRVQPASLNSDVIWDMMGLVDTVNLSVNSLANDYTVTITGRDYTKLLIEDGSYFIPLKYVEGNKDRWFYGGDPESEWFKRNMVTGAYDYYFAYSFQKIKSVLWFVINQLSTIGIVDNSVFASCAKVTKKYPVETGDDKYKGMEGQVNGIWQMIELFVDDNLNDRRIVDRSLVNPEGTLMDFFNKVCQEPFVEFWGDTWGNGFELIVRQPPFTAQAVENIISNDKYYVTVNSEDLFSIDLSYDDRAYAWYRLLPQNSMMGHSQFTSLAFVPIIFFEQVCKIYGNKRCIVNDIYLSESYLYGKESDKKKAVNTLSQAFLNDMLFVVESSVHLPFTRKGTITINGDRRIKVGTFIRLAPTNELFYVTGVNNTAVFSNDVVDRTTTITVERGMVMDYIPRSSQYSYFNIANIEGMRQEITQRDSDEKAQLGGSNSTPSNFGINEDQFNFFMNRELYKTEGK